MGETQGADVIEVPRELLTRLIEYVIKLREHWLNRAQLRAAREVTADLETVEAILKKSASSE
jgi:hypothetical protein